MDTMTNTKRVVVTARIAPALLAQLREIAAREDRSIGAEVRRAVSQHVEREQSASRRLGAA